MSKYSAVDIENAKRMHTAGAPPSMILRHFLLLRDDATIPDLRDLIHEAFDVPHDDLQCIGGWWHDGTGELSDVTIDSLLQPAIASRATLKR